MVTPAGADENLTVFSRWAGNDERARTAPPFLHENYRLRAGHFTDKRDDFSQLLPWDVAEHLSTNRFVRCFFFQRYEHALASANAGLSRSASGPFSANLSGVTDDNGQHGVRTSNASSSASVSMQGQRQPEPPSFSAVTSGNIEHRSHPA
ncbi:hypothetical protein [Escherichia coli]|uniref:hypothetical protein n=1 Tax=Escherichia coli TaxID=562 RepID=UPI00388E2040